MTAPLVAWQHACCFLSAIRSAATDPLVIALFPPRSGSSGGALYFPTTSEALIPQGDVPSPMGASIDKTLVANPGYGFGLILRTPLPTPPDWGTDPLHFYGKSKPDLQARRCTQWCAGQWSGSWWDQPRPFGTQNHEIAPSPLLVMETDHEGASLSDQLALATAVLGAPPSWTVDSGGKSLHCHLQLTAPLPPERITALQRLLVAAWRQQATNTTINPASVDASLVKAAQLMRAPGGIHPSTGRRTVIHSYTGHQFDADALQERLQAILPPPPPPAPHRPAPAPLRGTTGSSGPFPAPTLADIARALSFYPQRVKKQGGYPEHRRLAWGLKAAVIEAGGTLQDAIDLMERHSPSSTSGWNASGTTSYEASQVTSASFWFLCRQHGYRHPATQRNTGPGIAAALHRVNAQQGA